MSPETTDLVLASNIPDREINILVLHCLHVEADGRNGGQYFTQLELVEDCRLSSRIQTDHEDSHLAFGVEEIANDPTHMKKEEDL